MQANDSHKADDTQPFSKPDDRYKTLPRSSVPSSPSQIPVPSSPSQILVPSSPSQIPPKNVSHQLLSLVHIIVCVFIDSTIKA